MHMLTFLLFLISLPFISASKAAVPLIMKADIIINDFQTYWRDGQLLTVSSETKKGFLPLEENLETLIPTDLASWEPIKQTCKKEKPLSRTGYSYDVHLSFVQLSTHRSPLTPTQPAQPTR